MCEFITAGGFNHVDLPASPITASLVHEGELMRDALLHDLSELPYHIATTVDARLNRPQKCQSCLTINTDDDVWQIWAQQMQQADAVWLIAPETDGLLKKLTELAALQGALVLGCGPASIAITSEKLATYLALTQAGIATIATYTVDSWPNIDGQWITKPNDGAGCTDTMRFEKADDLSRWMMQHEKLKSHVIQPYLTGVAASISCVMHQGRAQVLSCNTQHIIINNNQLHYQGNQVNGMRDYWPQFEILAQSVAQIFFDLAGYVGIDVIVTKKSEGNVERDRKSVV